MHNYENSIAQAIGWIFVTNTYNAQGQNVQSFQTDNGQTNFYSPQGQYQGSSTTPIQTTPNTTINTPRQAPQVPTVKGW